MNYENVDIPFISVVMPVYNSEAYLAEAVESILAQSHSNFEFIIIDDCSTDSSAEIIRTYAIKDSRIRPLYLAHRGAGGAANAGIVAAKGELIARMDADDIALPERFSTQIAWMRHNGVDICGSCIKTFGAESRIMWFPEIHEAIRNEMVFRCALMQPTVMLRTEIAKKYLYNESLYFEDYELWTRLAPIYRMGNVPQVLLKYRTHPRQRHVQKSTDVCNELSYYCRKYFRTLFPYASIEEETAIASIACNKPLNSLVELEIVGTLLMRLADVSDGFLKERMAQRWWLACRNSTTFGLGSYHLYRQMAPVFGECLERRLILLIACALRLKPSSKIVSVARWIKKRAHKLGCK